MRQLWVMTASDLLQRVRDKSVIIFAVIVPLALMFVFDLAMGGIEDLELNDISVAAYVPQGDELGGIVVRAATNPGAFAVDLVPATDPGSVRDLVDAGDVTLGIVVPDGFADQLTTGREAVIDVVEGEAIGLEGAVVVAVMQAALDQIATGTEAATAGGVLGLPHDRLETIAQTAATAGPGISLSEGEASNEQLSLSASLIVGQAGLFLLFTVGFGVLALVAERETGTLARLRSMPMKPGRIVIAKAMVSFILGVVATSVLITLGSLFFGVSFGDPVAIAVLITCVVTAAVSLMFVVARVARTAEQAQISQAILAMVLGMSAGAFFPINATGLAGQLIDLNPIAAFMRGMGITYGGGGVADLGGPVLIMLGFAVLATLASRLIPDRSSAL
jgi:ABC-2 type transport system permease protein